MFLVSSRLKVSWKVCWDAYPQQPLDHITSCVPMFTVETSVFPHPNNRWNALSFSRLQFLSSPFHCRAARLAVSIGCLYHEFCGSFHDDCQCSVPIWWKRSLHYCHGRNRTYHGHLPSTTMAQKCLRLLFSRRNLSWFRDRQQHPPCPDLCSRLWYSSVWQQRRHLQAVHVHIAARRDDVRDATHASVHWSSVDFIAKCWHASVQLTATGVLLDECEQRGLVSVLRALADQVRPLLHRSIRKHLHVRDDWILWGLLPSFRRAHQCSPIYRHALSIALVVSECASHSHGSTWATTDRSNDAQEGSATAAMSICERSHSRPLLYASHHPKELRIDIEISRNSDWRASRPSFLLRSLFLHPPDPGVRELLHLHGGIKSVPARLETLIVENMRQNLRQWRTRTAAPNRPSSDQCRQQQLPSDSTMIVKIQQQIQCPHPKKID